MSAGKRDLKKELFWRRAVRQQADSGNSVRRWGRKQGLKEASFYRWRRELAQREAEPRSTAFVPVHVTADRPRDDDPRIEIVLTDGRHVGVHGPVDRQRLADVLAVLSSGSTKGFRIGPFSCRAHDATRRRKTTPAIPKPSSMIAPGSGCTDTYNVLPLRYLASIAPG